MSESPKGWLLQLARRALDESICTKLDCTTCGAMAFKKMFLGELGMNVPEMKAMSFNTGRQHVEELIQELLLVSRAGLPRSPQAEELMRYLVSLCWSHIGVEERVAVRENLCGTWAGSTLESMITHESEREARRTEHKDRSDPEKARIRREQMKAERQEKHEARRKYYRELWLAKQAASAFENGGVGYREVRDHESPECFELIDSRAQNGLPR